MKKEVIYSLRMSAKIRDALKEAAKEESRSMASLLDKIIKDYLSKKGLSERAGSGKDQRWFTRKEIFKPAKIYFHPDTKTEKISIVVLNISMGGVLIGYPKQSEIPLSPRDQRHFELCIDLSNEKKPICFQCEPKRMTDTGYGVQVAASFIDTDPDNLQMLRAYLN